jgi:acylphosphatase
MTQTVRVRVVIYGWVQGVFFRDTTRRRAEQRGVNGWVRNRADGSVEAVFEGAIEGVERFAEEPEGIEGFSVV